MRTVKTFPNTCYEAGGGAYTVSCTATGDSTLENVGVPLRDRSIFASIAFTLLALMVL